MNFEAEKIELIKLAENNNGLLLVDEIVESAKSETSPLHKHFTWDDSVAAQNYRLWQARVLTAKCRITIEDRTDTSVRAFVSLSTDRTQHGGGYRLLTDVQSNDEQLEILLDDINRTVKRWRKQAWLMDPATRTALDKLSEVVNGVSDKQQMSLVAA